MTDRKDTIAAQIKAGLAGAQYSSSGHASAPHSSGEVYARNFSNGGSLVGYRSGDMNAKFKSKSLDFKLVTNINEGVTSVNAECSIIPTLNSTLNAGTPVDKQCRITYRGEVFSLEITPGKLLQIDSRIATETLKKGLAPNRVLLG
jgi:hypothetical protein